MRTLPRRPSAPSLVTFDRRGVDVGGGDQDEAETVTTLVPSSALVELIGSETLQGIQDAFAIAFDIPTVILDHEGHNVNEITHRVAFCEDFTRPSRAGSKCLDCDRSGMRISSRTHRPTIFKCWNDLHDCTVPIAYANAPPHASKRSSNSGESPRTSGSRRVLVDVVLPGDCAVGSEIDVLLGEHLAGEEVPE